LERIADLSTNIAEEAIFSMENRIVKHHAEAVKTVDEMAFVDKSEKR